MFDNLYNSLSTLENSFVESTQSVLSSTKMVEDELSSISPDLSKKKVDDLNKIKKITTLIDKLSIQNEFKLNLLKDFSNYYLIKK